MGSAWNQANCLQIAELVRGRQGASWNSQSYEENGSKTRDARDQVTKWLRHVD